MAPVRDTDTLRSGVPTCSATWNELPLSSSRADRSLAQTVSLANEQQVPRRRIYGTCIGIEQTPNVQRSVELTDIDATHLRVPSHVVKKATTIRQELWREITSLLGQLRHRDRFSTCGRNAGDGTPERRKQNHIVPVPRAACTSRRVCQCLRRSAVDVDPPQLVVRKEADGLTVRRPERSLCTVSPGHYSRRTRFQGTQPQPRFAFEVGDESNGASVG